MVLTSWLRLGGSETVPLVVSEGEPEVGGELHLVVLLQVHQLHPHLLLLQVHLERLGLIETAAVDRFSSRKFGIEDSLGSARATYRGHSQPRGAGGGGGAPP